jgi:fructoselysine-6-P-deglycase FrlB-like protein
MTDSTGDDRVRQFETDIRDSPAALERLLDAQAAGDPPLRGLPRGRIVFTGLGSSRYAASIVAADARAGGSSAWVEIASSSAGSAPAGDLVLIAISASGRTPEVVEVAARHRGRILVVAVTNDAGSPLAAGADIVVPLLAGIETAGIASRTFRATIAALAILTGTPAGDLRPAVEGLAGRISTLETSASELADGLDGAPSIDVLAEASMVGLAEQAALMLREAPRLPATAYETGEWLHTGVYLALPGHRALLYPGAAADAEVVATMERRGGVALPVSLPGGPPTSPVVRALIDSVVAELVAVELWGRVAAEDRVD